MNLEINHDGLNALRKLILDFYKNNGNKAVNVFKEEIGASFESMAIYYLLDRRNVLQYSIGFDDKGCRAKTGVIMLGIGPHYFSPAAFWSYENFRRFKVAADPFDIQINLRLMDEFLGY